MLADTLSALPPHHISQARQLIPTPIQIVRSMALAATMLGTPAHAEEIRLLSAASMQTVFKEILGDFERASGHKITIRYSTMGAITDRVMSGEQADLIISSPASMSTLAAQGKINPASQITFAKTGIGIVVPSGSPKLVIGSSEDFKRALLASKVIVYANPAGGGAAGIHVARVIEKLGISEEIKPKLKLGAGGDVTEIALAQGIGALGITQVSEIVGKAGGVFVPIPDELQNFTGFTAGTPTGMKQSEAVRQFIDFLRSPTAAATMRIKGMQPS